MNVPDDISQESKDCLANRICSGCGQDGYLSCAIFLAGRLEHLRRKREKLEQSLVDPSRLPEQQLAYKREEAIDIPAAMARIDDALQGARGYGRCLSCRNPISKERLEHFPEAYRCVRCQEETDASTTR